MTEDILVFNGVDVDTGDYLFPSTRLADFAADLRDGDVPGGLHVAQLRRHHDAEEARLGVMYKVDVDNLASAGWALVTPTDPDPAVMEALQPLRTLRRQQAGDLYRELVVRPGEDDDAFLTRYGMAPGPVDPRRIPYYLLLVADPQDIPFAFQYHLDVEYAVGRIHFDTPAEYAAYAAQAVAAEDAAAPAPQRIHLFGTRNPGDSATALSASRLVAPMAEEIATITPGTTVTQDVGDSARRERLMDLLFADDAPPVLFTASHGLGGSGAGQRETQGALLCQDWPGPLLRRGRVDESHYVAGGHLPSAKPIRPRVVFAFACYGAGTPRESDIGDLHSLADRSFLGRLPQRLLGTPAGGALAFIGHVDRAFSCSFLWNGVAPQITALASATASIADGQRVGAAMEYVNSKYAAICDQLTGRLQALRDTGRLIDDRDLASLWTAYQDARNHVVLGDPAVRACSKH